MHTLFNPAPVIALTHMNRESVYETLRGGFDAPQKMRLLIKETKIKYA